MSWACLFDQGQTNSDVSVMTSNTGQANRNRGTRKSPRPRPLTNQTTISLSRYIRDKVLTMATNSESVRIMGRRPSAE